MRYWENCPIAKSPGLAPYMPFPILLCRNTIPHSENASSTNWLSCTPQTLHPDTIMPMKNWSHDIGHNSCLVITTSGTCCWIIQMYYSHSSGFKPMFTVPLLATSSNCSTPLSLSSYPTGRSPTSVCLLWKNLCTGFALKCGAKHVILHRTGTMLHPCSQSCLSISGHDQEHFTLGCTLSHSNSALPS